MTLKLYLLIFLSAINIVAQDNPDDSTYVLDSVLVTSSGNSRQFSDPPYMIDYMDGDKIRKGNTGISIDNISSSFAGVEINNRHNFSLGDKISIRGIGIRSSFGVRGVKILYDEIPLTLPDGQSQLSNLDLNSAGSIEILKGPASVLYGNSAGGVVNIKSEPASKELVSVFPKFILGSYGLQKYSLKASGTINAHSYLISFNKLNYKGYREHSAAASSVLNIFVNSIASDNLLLKGIFNYYYSPYLLNPGSLNKKDSENSPAMARSIIKQQGAGEKSSQLQGGLTVYYAGSDLSLESTIYFITRKVLNPIPGRIIDLKRNAGGFRNTLGLELNLLNKEINIQAGTDLEFQADTRIESANNGITLTNIQPDEIFKNINYGNQLLNQKENVFNSGTFLMLEMPLIKHFTISAGLRFDYYEFNIKDKLFTDLSDDSGLQTMRSLNPSAGIVYKHGETLTLYSNYSTSFLTPTTGELGNSPGGKGGLNPDLMPEKTINYEAGIRAVIYNLNFSAAAYYMNFTDMLIPYQLSGGDEVFYKNTGKARNTGLDLLTGYNLTKHLDVMVTLSYMDFKYADYLYTSTDGTSLQLGGNKVPGISPFRLGLTISYTSSLFFVRLLINNKDDSYTNDFNGSVSGATDDIINYVNKGYTEIHLRTGITIAIGNSSLQIFGGINNLLNQKYNSSIVPNAAGNRFFEPAPLRNWYCGIEAGF